jgi:hypothetical protein
VRRVSRLLLALYLGGASLVRAVPPAPSERALSLVGGLRATSMGVDHDGDLWTWDRGMGKVVLYSPVGAALSSLPMESVLEVDADRTAGIAAIADSGFELSVRPWSGGEGTTIHLPERASAVAWIDSETVALGMAAAGHRVEIWNVREKRLVKTLGSEAPVERKPGLSRLRTYQILYAPAQDLLFTLESFSGDLQVFSLDGRLVRREQVPRSDDRASIESWLADLDAKGRAAGEVKDPLITWYRLALDVAGNAWVVRTCEPKGRAMLWRVPASGPAKDVSLEEPCCARAFVIWGEHAIFYRDPSDPRLSCTGERRLP